MEVKDIIIYPIKSAGGIHLDQAMALEEGLKYDRRMMLADENGQFISQRNFPQLALVGAKLENNGFHFFKKSKPSDSIFIPHDAALGTYEAVRVWEHEFTARKVLLDIHLWFSEIVGMKIFLFKTGEKSNRTKELVKPPGITKVSMADGYPYLIISEASLRDLNRRLIVPVPMERFRPNIVIKNSLPYQEDGLDKIAIGEVKFRMIKECVRCVMVNIDQKTSKKLVEPLKTLSLYRKEDNNVYFGMNAIALHSGNIHVGDSISEI
ncbi:MOSC domain-containing protein [Portibacter lacus]|uniref:MOSC domain-containing protein n=1 Tax=Portibacter lacus TaxID=1099794 RepID=A0AA37SNG4_9BACT|nr:MOSC N-terminal beta barrel domain-containing protein [Portibacter lacus]GLR16299.1 hypothetical protein GCM10007940_09140 [Portibacter lacus]